VARARASLVSALSPLDAARFRRHHAAMRSLVPLTWLPLSLLVLAAALAVPARAESPADSTQAPAFGSERVRGWQTGALRPDRLQHASLSFALGLGAGLATDSPAASAGFALSLGVAKELVDAGGSGFDAADLLADAAGAALAAWAVHALRR
jgi:hypothetical protein